MKPIYKRDWFWFVALPTLLVAVVFVIALLFRLAA